eukprot:scaffold14166_cov20-Tisochrysis_lutea.AAC.1
MASGGGTGEVCLQNVVGADGPGREFSSCMKDTTRYILFTSLFVLMHLFEPVYAYGQEAHVSLAGATSKDAAYACAHVALTDAATGHASNGLVLCVPPPR